MLRRIFSCSAARSEKPTVAAPETTAPAPSAASPASSATLPVLVTRCSAGTRGLVSFDLRPNIRIDEGIGLLQLAFDQLGIYTVWIGHELRVCAPLHNTVFVDHANKVRVLDRAQPVRNDKNGPPMHCIFNCSLHQVLRLSVKGRRRLIQQQHSRVKQQCPGDGDALLPTTTNNAVQQRRVRYTSRALALEPHSEDGSCGRTARH